MACRQAYKILVYLILLKWIVKACSSLGYVISQSKEGILTALEVCRIHGMKLPTPTELESSWNATKYAEGLLVSSFLWTSLFKVSFSQWKMIDGRNYKEHLIPKTSRIQGQDCAVLRTKDKYIDEDYFTITLTGYLCSRNENNTDSNHIVQIYGHVVYFEQHPGPWYSAMKKCRDSKGILAAPPNASAENEWIKKISAHAEQHNIHGHYAIGLRRAAWFSVRKGHGYSDIQDDLKWGPGQPEKDGNCVMYGPKHYIRTAHCDRKESFLCLDTEEQIPCVNSSTPHPSTTNQKNCHKEGPALLIGLISAVSVIVCLLLSVNMCIKLIRLRRKAKETQGIPRRDGEAEVPLKTEVDDPIPKKTSQLEEI